MEEDGSIDMQKLIHHPLWRLVLWSMNMFEWVLIHTLAQGLFWDLTSLLVLIQILGFGFYVDEEGKMVKKPQILEVKIGDNVEVGANSCIDRGSWRATSIGNNTKIDNQVQIGHNVVIGHSCMICGQAGIGGSATIGDYVVLAGKAGVADHVSIASKVRIAAKSGVTRSITEPGDYAGFPAVPAKEWRKSVVTFHKHGCSLK